MQSTMGAGLKLSLRFKICTLPLLLVVTSGCAKMRYYYRSTCHRVGFQFLMRATCRIYGASEILITFADFEFACTFV
jgi:hypothetical protein